jgi:hypothetical protein
LILFDLDILAIIFGQETLQLHHKIDSQTLESSCWSQSFSLLLLLLLLLLFSSEESSELEHLLKETQLLPRLHRNTMKSSTWRRFSLHTLRLPSGLFGDPESATPSVPTPSKPQTVDSSTAMPSASLIIQDPYQDHIVCDSLSLSSLFEGLFLKKERRKKMMFSKENPFL